MSDDGKMPMQADGQDSPKRRADGMTPEQRGRSVGGESGGGAYADGGGKAAVDATDPVSAAKKA